MIWTRAWLHLHTHTLASPNNTSFEKQNVTSSIQRPEVPWFWSGEPRQETLVNFCLSPHGQPLMQLTEGRVYSELPWCTAAGMQQLAHFHAVGMIPERPAPLVRLTRAFHRKWRGKGWETLTRLSDLTSISKLLLIAQSWFQPNLSNWHQLVLWPHQARRLVLGFFEGGGSRTSWPLSTRLYHPFHDAARFSPRREGVAVPTISVNTVG